jgi:hypothetical protein
MTAQEEGVNDNQEKRMKRVTPRLVCDICERETMTEVPATRVLMIGEDGRARALDLCDLHDGNTRPSQLQELAKIYGTTLTTHVTGKGRLVTTPDGARRRARPYGRGFHEPGCPWAGELTGPATCLAPLGDGQTCGKPTKNVVGLKKHQWMKHGVTVRRT